MKNAYLFLMVLSLLKTASGQVEKPVTAGHFLVGGSISYYSQMSKQTLYVEPSLQYVLFTTKEDVFQPNVIIGYYIINHLALGLITETNAHAIRQTNNSGPEVYRYRYSTFGFGPLLRYSADFGLFIQGSTSFGFNKNYYSGEDKWRSQSYGLGAGYSFFIKEVLSIEPSISYMYTTVPSHGLESKVKTEGVFLAIGTYLYLDLVKRK